VVDADPELRSAVRHILPKAYEVIALASGDEVLELARAYQPDLIMLDVHLPSCNVFKLRRELRRRETFMPIPVIFLTVGLESPDLSRRQKADGDAFLAKPFGGAQLLGTIERLLDDGQI
jgi:DNA-binding response OmpR family regulator